MALFRAYGEVAPWIEQVEPPAARAVRTARPRYEICQRTVEEPRSLAEVARSLGWATARGAVEAHAYWAVDKPAGIPEVEALGIEEGAFLAAAPDHPNILVAGLVDARSGTL